MNKVKLLSILTLGCLSILAGCGDDSSSSPESKDISSDPIETKVEVTAGCQEITDEADKSGLTVTYEREGKTTEASAEHL